MNDDEQLSNGFQSDSSERIRWNLLGLCEGAADFDSEVADKIDGSSEEWEKRLRQSIIRSHDKPKSRFRITAGRNLIALASVALITLSALTLRIAGAQQNRKITQNFGNQVLSFVLDLYEEDLNVMKRCANDVTDKLPQASYFGVQRPSRERMNYCADALEGLIQVRMGFPEAAVKEKTVTKQFIEFEQIEMEPHFELAYQVIASKSLIEARDLSHGRVFTEYLKESAVDLNVVIIDSQKRAFQILQDQLDLNSESKTLLQAAILIDGTRGVLKNYHQPDKSFKKLLIQVETDLSKATTLIQSLPTENRYAMVQLGRCLNHQLLMINRKSLLPEFGIDIAQQYNIYYEKVKQLHAVRHQLNDNGYEHLNAIDFEIGIAFSNLADFLWNLRKLTKLQSLESMLLEELQCRRLAIKNLQRIPASSRTKRHFENLVINYARLIETQVADQLLSNDAQPSFEAMQFDSVILEALVGGDILDADVGQLRETGCLATAIVLNSFDDRNETEHSFDRIDSYFNKHQAKVRPFDQVWYQIWRQQQLEKQ